MLNGRHLSNLPNLNEITACSKFQSIFSPYGPFEELFGLFSIPIGPFGSFDLSNWWF